MSYHRIATSLLLLQHGASAFRASPPHDLLRNGPPPPINSPTGQQQRRRRQPGALRMAASLEESSASSSLPVPPLESILDDGHGHINGDLAQAIYEWELSHNGHQAESSSTTKQFSTRDGLRMVDDLAREILSSLRGVGGDDDDDDDDDAGRKSGISYNDLVQEGMIALLRSMSTYESYRSHTTASRISTFAEYSEHSIRSSLLHFLARSSRPIRLPLSLQTTLEAANAAAGRLRGRLGREPSLVQVAGEVGMAPEQLALYRKLHRSMVSRVGAFVSVEDGMEVYDPTLAGVGGGTGLRSTRDLDGVGGGDAVDDARGGGASADGGGGGTSLSAPSSATANEQDLTQLNSQEDDWLREPPERVVAPLRDVLADAEEINNPLSYTHHYLLNEELDEFLLETLTGEELSVIQLRFGLVDSKHGGKGWTSNEIGRRMGMDREDVVVLASGALEKLRKAAATNWEEENDANVEVSL